MNICIDIDVLTYDNIRIQFALLCIIFKNIQFILIRQLIVIILKTSDYKFHLQLDDITSP